VACRSFLCKQQQLRRCHSHHEPPPSPLSPPPSAANHSSHKHISDPCNAFVYGGGIFCLVVVSLYVFCFHFQCPAPNEFLTSLIVSCRPVIFALVFVAIKYAAFNLHHARVATTHTHDFFHPVTFDPGCLFAFTAACSELKSGGMVAGSDFLYCGWLVHITLGFRRLLLLCSRSCSCSRACIYSHLSSSTQSSYNLASIYMTWSSINTRFFKQGGSGKEEKEEEMVAVCARVHTHTQSQSQGKYLTFDLHERARVS
jgi:hypothetical protein